MTIENMTAVILSGGRSSRMGVNKMTLPLGKGTVISHTIEALQSLFEHKILVTDQPHLYRHLPVRLAKDVISCPVKNALVGIHGGLSASAHHYNFVVAGDMPFLSSHVIEFLCEVHHGYDLVIPGFGPECQPLCAIYSKNCLPIIEKHLAKGCYKISDILPFVRVRHVKLEKLRFFDPELRSFFNINSPSDYLLAQVYAEKKHFHKKPELLFR